MVYKTISSKNIIARVFRDLKTANADWTTDAIEWLGEVIERIGSYATLERKSVTYKAVDYKIPYPCDMESLNRVDFCGTPLGFAGGNLDIYQGEVSVFPVNRLVYQYQGNYFITGATCLTCSEENMEVTLHYTAFPLDKEGYPMIPDNFFYKTACFWYIASRLAMRQEQSIFNFEYCQERFNTYAQLAENDCAFPSPLKMERFIDRWVRIVPNVSFRWKDMETNFLEIVD